MAAVTLTKGIWPHELIPVKCKVFVLLLIIVIQQLPKVLLTSQNLCMSCLKALMEISWCSTVKESMKIQINNESSKQHHGDNSHLQLRTRIELWSCNHLLF